MTASRATTGPMTDHRLTPHERDPRFLDPMVTLVGDPTPQLFTEKLNLERPRCGGVNPLHRDHPYWEGVADDPSRVATAMLFLDDASSENGALQVLPGSRRTGTADWGARPEAPDRPAPRPLLFAVGGCGIIRVDDVDTAHAASSQPIPPETDKNRGSSDDDPR